MGHQRRAMRIVVVTLAGFQEFLLTKVRRLHYKAPQYENLMGITG
jgi:hypothetical protein